MRSELQVPRVFCGQLCGGLNSPNWTGRHGLGGRKKKPLIYMQVQHDGESGGNHLEKRQYDDHTGGLGAWA
jgi:hypothetical protein